MTTKWIKCISYVLISFATLCIAWNSYEIMLNQTYLTGVEKETYYHNELFNLIDKIEEETKHSANSIDSIKRSNIIRNFSYFIDFDINTYKFDTLNVPLSSSLKNRIALFTDIVTPHYMVDEDGQLSCKKYSPERLKLFSYLAKSFVNGKDLFYDLNFSNIEINEKRIDDKNLRGLDMSNSDISNCIFLSCDLSGANFDNSNLNSVRFSACNMIPIDFENTILDTMHFDYSYLPYAIHFKNAEIKYINLDNAKVPGKEWLDKVKQYAKSIGNLDDFEVSEQPCDTLIKYVNDPIYFYRIIYKK